MTQFSRPKESAFSLVCRVGEAQRYDHPRRFELEIKLSLGVTGRIQRKPQQYHDGVWCAVLPKARGSNAVSFFKSFGG